MSRATRKGDYNSGHDSCPPTSLVEGSNNVYINGKNSGRVGDKYSTHGCEDHPYHQDNINTGSSTVFINGKFASRVGDSVYPSGTVIEGSSNVFIGG